MDITGYIKKNGINVTAKKHCHRWGIVHVGFYNTQDECDDETSFDVEMPLSGCGAKDLATLFENFCKENDFATGTVQYVECVALAETREELEALSL